MHSWVPASPKGVIVSTEHRRDRRENKRPGPRTKWARSLAARTDAGTGRVFDMGKEKWEVNDILLLKEPGGSDDGRLAGIADIDHEKDHLTYQVRETGVAVVAAISETDGKVVGVLTQDGPVITHSGTPETYGKLLLDASNLRMQINNLADFIMAEIAGEPSQSEGAVETDIRVMRKQQTEINKSHEG